jgi:hypothetical protein
MCLAAWAAVAERLWRSKVPAACRSMTSVHESIASDLLDIGRGGHAGTCVDAPA